MTKPVEVLNVEVDAEMLLLLRVHAAAVKITVGEALMTWARCGLDKILAGVAVNGSSAGTEPIRGPRNTDPRRTPKLRNKPSISKPSTPKPSTGKVQPDPLPFDEKPIDVPVTMKPALKRELAAKAESACDHVWRYVDHSGRRSDICTVCSLRRAHAHNWRIAQPDPFDETDIQRGSCACGATREFDPRASDGAPKSVSGFSLKGSHAQQPVAAVNTVAVPHQKKTGTVQKCGACGNHPRSQAHADACRGGERARGGPGPHGRVAAEVA